MHNSLIFNSFKYIIYYFITFSNKNQYIFANLFLQNTKNNPAQLRDGLFQFNFYLQSVLIPFAFRYTALFQPLSSLNLSTAF